MSKAITKITQSNFPDAVKYAYAYKRKRTVANYTRKVILPLGSILFVLHALFITVGGISAIMDEGELAAIENLNFITGYWDKVLETFRSITELWYLHIPMMLVYLFLVPFAVCSVLALVVALLTRVKRLTVSGAHHEQAKQLMDYTADLPTSTRDDEDAHKLWRRITGIAYVVGLVAFIVYFAIAASKAGDETTDNTVLYMLVDGIVGILIAFALLYVVYTLLHRLFTLILRPYYIADDQSNKLASVARSYWVSVDPEEQRKAKERAKKARERRQKAKEQSRNTTTSYSGSYSGTYSSPPPMTRAEKQQYIDQHCHGMFSYGGIETIENDPNLTASQKEDLKMHLKIWGD